jgi:hypothetical protein
MRLFMQFRKSDPAAVAAAKAGFSVNRRGVQTPIGVVNA